MDYNILNKKLTLLGIETNEAMIREFEPKLRQMIYWNTIKEKLLNETVYFLFLRLRYMSKLLKDIRFETKEQEKLFNEITGPVTIEYDGFDSIKESYDWSLFVDYWGTEEDTKELTSVFSQLIPEYEVMQSSWGKEKSKLEIEIKLNKLIYKAIKNNGLEKIILDFIESLNVKERRVEAAIEQRNEGEFWSQVYEDQKEYNENH